MKKLSVTQWITLIVATVGMLMETEVLGSSEFVNEILSKILLVAALVKFVYDQYNSFNEDDMLNFADDSKSKRVSGRADIEVWRKSQ